MNAVRRTAIVLGGDGALGRAVVGAFRASGWNTVSIDYRRSTDATESLLLQPHAGTKEAWASELQRLVEQTGRWTPAHAVVCAAGGWAGGSVSDPAADVSNAMSDMLEVCLRPVLAAAHIAANALDRQGGGSLVVLGSAAALHPTPSMLAYGAVKAATHHMIGSLAQPGGGLPAGSRVIGVLPTVLDTPTNRKYMATGSDTSNWTPLPHVATRIVDWCSGTIQVASGTMALPETAHGVTNWRVRQPDGALL